MSIKALTKDHNKSWLKILSNTLETKNLDVNSGEVLNIEAGGIVKLNGLNGNINQVIKQRSGNIVWEDQSTHGTSITNHSMTPGIYTTTSTSFIQVPTSVFSTSSLPAGDYIIFSSIECRNTTSDMAVQFVFDPAGVALTFSSHYIKGSYAEFYTTTFMGYVTLTGVNTFEHQFKIFTAGTAEVQNGKCYLYRIS